MPRLWTQTIETHRREVGDAILDTTVALVAERGMRGVTMSEIAEQAGVGRATLYKYFPDVESILLAWHERHVAGHLAHLERLSDGTDDPRKALESVLGAYALVVHERARALGGTDVAALVHHGEQVGPIEAQLDRFLSGLLADAGRAGALRTDVAVPELASYCLHALGAAANAPSRAAVRRLVALTLAGLDKEAESRA
ncbi:MAG: TetR/AcrR family transcriptional regulator [Actinomycetota bacterium]|nr:TetR/AcrR family transcriptional regulator [Actinomycetota bacterium]